MDFAYDSPQRSTHASGSSWLRAEPGLNGDTRKRDHTQVQAEGKSSAYYTFGSQSEKDGESRSTGAFLFHQPVSPTLSGPDVEMVTATPPKADNGETKKGASDAAADGSPQTARPLASLGAIARTQRARSGKRIVSLSSSHTRRKQRHANRKGSDREKEDSEYEWEDEEEPEARTSLRKRMGDTMNIQYFLDGGRASPTPVHRRIDPEWCLGMAQFTFNTSLLFGAAWIMWGIVATLKRDVADKVREYELGE